MTVKELYDYAVKTGNKNAPIIINYNCNDDWYNYCEELHKEEVGLSHKNNLIIITICNY